MSKYTNIKKLTKKEQDELFVKFAKALGALRNSTEAASFIRDLYTEQEALMLARRLQISELLSKGFTYDKIHKVMRVSDGTIAKVQSWLNIYGEGFRTVLKRSKNKATAKSDYGKSWQSLKKKYPMYYWPELLLNEIIKNAGKREKRRLLRVIQGMREKTKLTKQLLTLLS